MGRVARVALVDETGGFQAAWRMRIGGENGAVAAFPRCRTGAIYNNTGVHKRRFGERDGPGDVAAARMPDEIAAPQIEHLQERRRMADGASHGAILVAFRIVRVALSQTVESDDTASLGKRAECRFPVLGVFAAGRVA